MKIEPIKAEPTIRYYKPWSKILRALRDALHKTSDGLGKVRGLSHWVLSGMKG
jgi:hypothetical protein